VSVSILVSSVYMPRSGIGEGDGREVQKEGDICIPIADSC